MQRPTPTQTERHFDPSEIIVSKTDLKGRITYANSVFCKTGLYSEDELLGKPHSILRHPDMPRCAFYLLWQEIAAGREFFAYVKNLAKNGDFYWVFAHVTPSFSADGAIEGYHSNRRVPDRRAVETVSGLYAKLLAVEQSHSDPKAGMQAGVDALMAELGKLGVDYETLVFSLVD